MILKAIIVILTTSFATVCLAQPGSIRADIRNFSGVEDYDSISVYLSQGERAVVSFDADTSGRFQIDSLEPGLYDIRVVKPGYNDVIQRGILVNSWKYTILDIVLLPVTVSSDKRSKKKRR